MSAKEDDAQAGPSDAESPQPVQIHILSEDNLDQSTSSEKMPKNVRFRSEEEDSGQQQQQTGRRQSMVGTPGYVSQILKEFVDDPDRKDEKETRIKPIRKQTREERRASVSAVDADLSNYMREVSLTPRKSSVGTKRSGSQIKLSTSPSLDKLNELRLLSKDSLAGSRPTSEWMPSELLQVSDEKKERSWVGTYIVGKDYWAAKEKEPKEDKRVSFSADVERKPWYDMPMTKPPVKDAVLSGLKSKSMSKMEELKAELGEEYEDKRKQQAVSPAAARLEVKATQEWTDEFREYFANVAESTDFSHRGAHMSLVAADKWLERAGILDHSALTALHTGFTFLACGGSKNRGLSFEEFTSFLQIIASTTGLSIRDIVQKLSACMRKSTSMPGIHI